MSRLEPPGYWCLFDPEYPEGLENLPPVKRDERGNPIIANERAEQMTDITSDVPQPEGDRILKVDVVTVSPGSVDLPGDLAKRVNAKLRDLSREGTPGFRVELGSGDVIFCRRI